MCFSTISKKTWKINVFELILNINLIRTFLISKYVGDFNDKTKKCKIISVSSTNGINSYCPTTIDYDVSKVGVIFLTKI